MESNICAFDVEKLSFSILIVLHWYYVSLLTQLIERFYYAEWMLNVKLKTYIVYAFMKETT